LSEGAELGIDYRELTAGRRLAASTLWNLAGTGAPLVVAIVAIPLLIHHLGTDRFGLLTLAWILAGHLNLFDFGLGRGLTQLVATRIADPNRDLPVFIWTSLVIMIVLGVLAGAIVGLLAPWFVHDALRLRGSFGDEAVLAFRVLALALPLVVSTTGVRGILEAQQRFDLSNAIRVPMGVFTFLGPLLVLPFSHSLVPVFALLVSGRAVAWVAYLALCTRTLAVLREGVHFHLAAALPVLRLGGWMSVSNAISPIMSYFDRFVVGSLVTVTAVAYYATPYDMVTKLAVIPTAVSSVLFPAFAMSFAKDRFHSIRIFEAGVNHLFLVLFPSVLIIEALSWEGLAVWLGRSFASESVHVLQVLAIGVFVNGLAAIPFAFLQGVARPDIPAKLHLGELPFYLVALWTLTVQFGILGAALAWTLRVLVDMIALYILAWRLMSAEWVTARRMVLVFCLATIVLITFAGVTIDTRPRLLALLVVLAGFSLFGLFGVLPKTERQLLSTRLRRLWRAPTSAG
jgi:O-antigen/teichoic acid export membrane protein